jgi:hypothetical protein
MTHKQKRIFFNWLQKRGALKAYKLARCQQKMEPPFKSYEEMLFSHPIRNAFHWIETLEGFDFWNKLDNEWYDYFESLKHE